MKRFEENILRIYSTSRLTNFIYTMFYGWRVPIFRSDPPTMMPHILASFHAQSRPSTPILRMKRTCSSAQKFECWAILSTQICDLSTIFQLIQYILLMIQKAQTTTWAPTCGPSTSGVFSAIPMDWPSYFSVQKIVENGRYPIPETNGSHLKIGHRTRKLVYVSFREGNFSA